MAKLKGPALSAAASGKLGDSVVYSNWRGRPYAKHAGLLNNPNTASQVGSRAILRFLSMNYADLSAAQIATWSTIASDRKISAYNAFTQFNLERWRNYLLPTKVNPAHEGAPAGQIVFALAFAALRGLTIALSRGAANLAWGNTIHRSTTSGFTPSSANCIRVVFYPWTEGSSFEYHDPKLEPDTYYYRVGSFSDSGRNTPAYASEFSGVVT